MYAFQTSLNQVVRLQQEDMHRLELSIRAMNAHKDKDAFLGAHQGAFAPPETFQFYPHGGDDVSRKRSSYSWLVDYIMVVLHFFVVVAYTGWPRKNATLTINNFKKTKDRMNKLCALLRIEFFSKQDDTKIVNFDEGVLILWPLRQCHFQDLPFYLKSHNLRTEYIPIVWPPRVNCQLLLCKANPAWIIKRSIHYVTLQHYNPGELLKEIPPYLKRDFWYKRSKFWKLHCLRKMALESKCLHQNH